MVALALGEAAALLPPVPPPPLLPHAASTAAEAAMATAGRIRRIGKPPVRAGMVTARRALAGQPTGLRRWPHSAYCWGYPVR